MEPQEAKGGTLYVVSTPIGNYRDVTQRARDILESADIIAAEDTRRTLALLRNLGIRGRGLFSNHKFNEYAKARYFIDDLLAGKSVAIVTDAGTPCISDPGNDLIRAAAERGIPVRPVPGCCAAVAALSVCGFDLRTFAFYGFFPRDTGGKTKLLKELLSGGGPRTAVFYESPKRILETVRFFTEAAPEVRLCLCNDLTKFYEYSYRGTPAEVLEELTARGAWEKGEYVLVAEFPPAKKEEDPEGLSPEALLTEQMVRRGCTVKEAIRFQLAEEGNPWSKNRLYQAGLKLRDLFGGSEDGEEAAEESP